MRKLNWFNISDERQNVWTYELNDGRHVKLDRDAVRKYGASSLLRDCGVVVERDDRMLPVFQCGQKVGVLPAEFDPDTAKSTTFLCDFRPGDFKRDGDKWVACRTLGPGDLDACTQFRRTKEPAA